MQPDVEDLENGAEEEGDTDSVKSEVKLGKLQFSLDYDFQEGKVGIYSSSYIICSLFR